LALTEIVESIIRDEYSVLTVSTLLKGEYGIKGIYLSLPCVVNRQGVERKMMLSLSPDEESALCHSAAVLKQIQSQIKL
jgi:L-lactate dehydrogenase